MRGLPDSNITKRALAQAMKALMAKRPFAKISVGDICEACGMNRKSFYYHFRDKQDLVNWIFYSEFVESLQWQDEADSWTLLSRICHYFYRERSFYRKALAIDGQNSFRDYFIDTIRPFLQLLTNEMFGEREVEYADFYITFFADAFLASLIRWLTYNDECDPDTYLDKIKSLLVAVSKSTIRKLPEAFQA